jgi:NAD(P)-dependent dehydrogenase (short-subunit alcohol dehydrogenase family)
VQNPPYDPQTSFAGKSVLITGANVGLGLEAAVKFAALGASRLVLGVRSLERGEEAKAEICRRAGFPVAKVQLYRLDMSTFEGVKSFTKSVTEKEKSLDIVVLNAGIAAPAHQLSPDGYEMVLQVNVLSTALLAVLLFPLLQQTAQKTGEATHMEFVGSVGHRMLKSNTLDAVLDNSETSIIIYLNDNKNYTPQNAYCISKLLLMYIMDGLVSACRSHRSDQVIITTCCPNLCRTNIGREFSIFSKLANHLFQSVFARTAEEGSRILVSGTTLDSSAMGQFWSHDVFDR